MVDVSTDIEALSGIMSRLKDASDPTPPTQKPVEAENATPDKNSNIRLHAARQIFLAPNGVDVKSREDLLPSDTDLDELGYGRFSSLHYKQQPKSETKEKTEGKGDILKVAPFMIGSAGHDLLEYALVYGSIPEHPIGPEDGFWRTLYKTEPAKYQAIVNGLKEITHDFYDELQLSPTTLSTYLTEIYFGQSRQTQKAMKEKEESGLWQISDIPTYEKTEGIHSDDYITASARTDVINLTSESEQPEVAACLEAVNDLVQREKVSFGKRAMHDIHTFTEDEVKTMKQLTHFILDGTINVRFIEMKFQCNAENNFDPNPTEELYDDVAHSLFAIRELLGVFSPEVFEEENMAKFLSHIKAYVAYGYLPAFDYTNKFPVAPKKVDHKLVRLSWPLIAQHFVKVPEKILKKKGAIPV